MVDLPVLVSKLLDLLVVFCELVGNDLTSLLPAFHETLPGFFEPFSNLRSDLFVFLSDFGCFIIFLEGHFELYFFFG